MKKFLAGVIGLAAWGLAAPASAADVAAHPYAPVYSYIPALYDWSGFYVGANGGYGSNHSCRDSADTLTGAFLAHEGCNNSTGGVAGAQIGYRWQAASWVFGLDAQGDWAGIRGSNVNPNAPATTNRSRIDSLGLFTAQIGYAWNNALLYVKGGGAVADARYDVFTTVGNIPFSTAAFDQGSWGGVAGVGMEYGFATNWSAAVEYNHLFLPDHLTGFNTVPPPGVLASTERVRASTDLVTVRVNYRWGGPVIGKY